MAGRRPRSLVALALATIVLTAASAGSASATTSDWPAYLLGPRHHSWASQQVAITPSNASTLAPDWTWQPDPPAGPNPPPNVLTSSPTVYGGTIYIGANTGVFYAIDDSTGTTVWSRSIGFAPALTCSPALGFTSTATVAPDPVSNKPTVYVAAADGYLYALDAATGNTTWRAQVVVPSATVNDYYLWGSPTVRGGHIYIGVASNCDDPLVRGGVVELSQATGARIAGWYAVPKGSVGAAVWSSVAVAGGSVFATTGNSATRKTQTGYPDSIVSLSADGLKRTGSWTVPRAAQLVDGDFGASPTTFTGAIGGRPVAIVSACNKNGRLYVLRAADLSAGPVWSFKLASAAVAGTHHCLAGNVFDGGHLIAGAAATSIQGVSYLGSVREFDASTGAVIWQTGLPAEVLGTPALDGGGVLAAPTMDPSTGASNAVYLLDASDGTILAQLPTGADGEFAQPIFADGHLFLATLDQGLTSYSPS